MTVQTRWMTAQELAAMSHDNAHVELVKGEVVEMVPAGAEHGEVAGNVFAPLHLFVRQRQLGKVSISAS